MLAFVISIFRVKSWENSHPYPPWWQIDFLQYFLGKYHYAFVGFYSFFFFFHCFRTVMILSLFGKQIVPNLTIETLSSCLLLSFDTLITISIGVLSGTRYHMLLLYFLCSTSGKGCLSKVSWVFFSEKQHVETKICMFGI